MGTRQAVLLLAAVALAAFIVNGQARTLTQAPGGALPMKPKPPMITDSSSPAVSPQPSTPGNSTLGNSTKGDGPASMNVVQDAKVLKRLKARRVKRDRKQPAKVRPYDTLTWRNTTTANTTGRAAGLRMRDRRIGRLFKARRAGNRTGTVRSGRTQRNLLQAPASPPVSYLLAGECIQATTAESWLISSNAQFSLVISTSECWAQLR